MRNKKAFTLIELIAVLVILAILALIVTPIVMSIINKAKTSANKRSIDAYGRSIELAIASHMLDTGEIPTSIDELTIEYSGDEVVCETTQIKSDSTVYLAGCTVGGKAVEGYTYGKDNATTYKAYSVGDEVTYNNINYYVIKNSDSTEANVTLLKAEPLTVAEVNEYGGVGTENNHVNMHITSDTNASCYQTAADYKGDGTVGGMQYYSSETCGYDNNNNWVVSGCTTDYADSEIKYVVDAWKNAQAPMANEARLISKDEYQENCVEEEYQSTPSDTGTRYVSSYDWMYSQDYFYWTYTPYNDSSSEVWFVNDGGILSRSVVNHQRAASVRPVIVLPKSALN